MECMSKTRGSSSILLSSEPELRIVTGCGNQRTEFSLRVFEKTVLKRILVLRSRE